MGFYGEFWDHWLFAWMDKDLIKSLDIPLHTLLRCDMNDVARISFVLQPSFELFGAWQDKTKQMELVLRCCQNNAHLVINLEKCILSVVTTSTKQLWFPFFVFWPLVFFSTYLLSFLLYVLGKTTKHWGIDRQS